MKKPALHVTTEAQVDQVIDWLYNNGYTICRGTKDAGRKMVMECLKYRLGINIYYTVRAMCDVCNHPTAWNHTAYTRVNSLNHFKHYLKRHSL